MNAIDRNRKAARIVLAAAHHIALADDGAARAIFSRALEALDNERRRILNGLEVARRRRRALEAAIAAEGVTR